MLTKGQKSRLDIYKYLLPLYEDEPEEFMHETWVLHFDPAAKKQSMLWKHPGLPNPKKFWDSQGIIMIDYLEEGSTINGSYYAEELRRLHQEIVKKRRGKLTQGVLLL